MDMYFLKDMTHQLYTCSLDNTVAMSQDGDDDFKKKAIEFATPKAQQQRVPMRRTTSIEAIPSTDFQGNFFKEKVMI